MLASSLQMIVFFGTNFQGMASLCSVKIENFSCMHICQQFDSNKTGVGICCTVLNQIYCVTRSLFFICMHNFFVNSFNILIIFCDGFQVVTFWEGEIVDTKNYTFYTDKWEATYFSLLFWSIRSEMNYLL